MIESESVDAETGIGTDWVEPLTITFCDNALSILRSIISPGYCPDKLTPKFLPSPEIFSVIAMVP